MAMWVAIVQNAGQKSALAGHACFGSIAHVVKKQQQQKNFTIIVFDGPVTLRMYAWY